MENKNVGYLLLGVSILIIIIIFMFKNTLTGFVDSSCTLAHGGGYCPMYDTISQQTYLALGIIGILVIVSLVLIFSKPQTQTIIKTKTIEKKNPKKEINLTELKTEDIQAGRNLIIDAFSRTDLSTKNRLELLKAALEKNKHCIMDDCSIIVAGIK